MHITDQDLEKPIGEFITPIEAYLNINDRIEDALKKIRTQLSSEKIMYFYAVDDEGRLIGTLSTRRLLLADPTCFVGEVVQEKFIFLVSNQTLEEAMNLFEKHHLLALPVLDENGKLLGALNVGLYIDGSFNVADARHRRDVFQIMGLSVETGKKTSIFQDYRFRMPWLFCNMISGFICALIASANEAVLNEFLLLAMFIPLVLTLSESVSMQSMTQSLQFLRRPKITLRYICLQVKREWGIVFLIALSSSIIVGLFSVIWGDGIVPSLVIGFGILFSVIFSAGFGIIFPIFIHKTKLDPKVASGPVVLMFADALTTFVYLTAATWILLS